jgi:hypothetical protein
MIRRLLADTTDEDLACLFLLVARDGALGVNLFPVSVHMISIGKEARTAM